jgi:hypothetical protein
LTTPHWLLAALFVIQNAQAASVSVIEFGAKPAAPRKVVGLPAACRVISRAKHEGSLCSGSYIGDGLVVTAAHCLEALGEGKIQGIEIGCGYLGVSSSGKPEFLENFHVIGARFKRDRTQLETDVAIMRLNKSPEFIQPLRIARSFEELQAELLVSDPMMEGQLILSNEVECRYTGFGMDRITQKARYHESDQSPANGLKA